MPIISSLANLLVCVDGSLSLSLQMSSSDDEFTSTHTAPTNTSGSGRSGRRTGGWVCQALGCLASFRQSSQLAKHYTVQHTCDFGPPRDSAVDLAIYNRCMTYLLPITTPSRKRQRVSRLPSAGQRRQPKQAKRGRSKSGYGSC